MKTKIIIALVAIVGTLELAGCKPKPVTLAGQVFIATQGGDNVKLGDVEILLIEKSQVTDYLQSKQAVVESVIAARQQEIKDAKRVAEKLRVDYTFFLTIKNSRPDLDDPPKPYSGSLPSSGALQVSKYALNDYRLFLKNSFFNTNTDCIKIKSQMEILWRQQQTLATPIDSAGAQLQSALHQGMFDEDKVNALSSREDALREQWNRDSAELDSLLKELEDTIDREVAGKKTDVEAAEFGLEVAKKKLGNSPTSEDYLNDFSPVVVKKTLSDADGKFSFVYPRDKSFTIYASAQRVTLNGTEKYYWLIDAPTNAETLQVFLSNNNLVFVDPDGYFKLKPKETPTVKVSVL